ncbi:MAG: SRPBCC family protein [Allorhizobium sp.]
MNELELTVRHTISASRQKVFDAWLSPAVLSKFMGPPGGTTPARVTNDPVKGGRFSIVMFFDGKEIPHAGTYLEIAPHSRLAFTWESPHSLDDSVVTIDFSELGPDRTEITLTQVKFRSESARDGHKEGWNTIFEALEKVIG